MYKILENTLLFVVVVLLQVFLFDNLQVGAYINIFVYIAFVIMLPMETNSSLVLILAALLGVTMDIFMGTPALNTISTTLVAFCRPTMLNFFVGKDEVNAGGVPNINRIGMAKFIRYSFVLVLIHSASFFMFESMSLAGIGFFILRILLSAICSIIAVYFCQLLFVVNRSKI